MATPSERRALLFVAAVAALGLAVRGWRALGSDGAGRGPEAALAAQIAAVDSAVTVGGRSRRAKAAAARATPDAAASSEPRSLPPAPAAPAAPVDVDRADAAALDALPGIGPALAHRIVAEREARGPFGSLDALQDVRGIGPALAARLEPHVTFSGPPRQRLAAPRRGGGSHP